MKVMYVVMRNDFPVAVFDTLAAAEAYCEKRRKKGPPGGWPRVYDFILNAENERNASS